LTIFLHLSTSEGVNAQARLAFNMTHGSGLSAVERDVAMLAAANDAVDESGGIRAFFKRWDHDGDRTLNAAELCAGLKSTGMSISALDCARLIAAFGSSAVTNGQLHRLLSGAQPLPATVPDSAVPTSAMLDPNNRRTWGSASRGGEEAEAEDSGAVAAGGASARSEPQWAKLQRPHAVVEVPQSGRGPFFISAFVSSLYSSFLLFAHRFYSFVYSMHNSHRYGRDTVARGLRGARPRYVR
jgi:hypothetical protein